MKEVSTPLAAIRTENSMMDFLLPNMSEMIPAENVPTANPRKKRKKINQISPFLLVPEKKNIYASTGRLLLPQTKPNLK